MKRIFAWCWLGVLLGLCGCLSLEDELARQEQQVQRGEVAAAYTAAAEAASEDGVDQVYWQETAGTLAMWLGNPTVAVAHLSAADDGFNDVARRRYGATAGDTAKTLAVNDCLLPYAPEGPDRVFVNLYKAVAYGVQQKPGAMRVECNRVRQRQMEWFGVCAGEIASAADGKDLSTKQRKAVSQTVQKETKVAALSPQASHAISEESSSAAKYFTALQGFGNAYAAHLVGVARWCAGDSPRNDLAMAEALAPGVKTVAQDAAMAERGGRPQGRVWIYVEDGLAPKRVGRPYSIPYPSIAGHGAGIGTISFDVPKLVKRAGVSGNYTVNGTALERLADVDALAEDAFNREWPQIIARQVARTILRVTIHETGQAIIRNQTGNELAPLLFSLGMAVYDVSTNAADLRCADLLPKSVWVGALARPADGQLTLRGNGVPALSVKLNAAGNALVWVRYATRGSAPTVMVVDLDAKE